MNIWGSLRKIKSGRVKSVYFLRQYIFFFRPSMFQVREDSLKLPPTEMLLALLIGLGTFTGGDIGVTSELVKEEAIDTELVIEESTDRGNDGVAEER